MFGFAEPGVRVVQEAPIAGSNELPTAMPLFVGYTEKGGMNQVYELGSYREYVAACGGAPSGAAPAFALFEALEHYFQVGGGRCGVLSLGHYEDFPSDGKLSPVLRAVPWAQVAGEAPRCTLLAVPDLRLLDGQDGSAWVSAWRELLKPLVHEWRMLVVLDGPEEPDTLGRCLKDIAGEPFANLACGALYWPRLLTENQLHGRRAPLPCSAAVVAMMQRTDQERGIWKAPANELLPRVLRPSQERLLPQEPESASLNRIRSLPRRGVRVWGDRTLLPETVSLASPWRYVQVRRTATHVQASLCELVRFALFEPNNAITWIKLEGVMRVWLRKLWQAGGLAGREEREAFRTRVGLNQSMTQRDLQQGLLIVETHLAFQAPAEFIELHIQLQSGDAQVTAWMSAANLSEVRL